MNANKNKSLKTFNDFKMLSINILGIHSLPKSKTNQRFGNKTKKRQTLVLEKEKTKQKKTESAISAKSKNNRP